VDFRLCSKACIRGLGTEKCNHPLKFTGCVDEKDIFIIRYFAGGCTSAANQDQGAKDATESFYKSYFSVFGSDETRLYPADELRKYVSADTIARIDAIQEISEQELIESDYFTYTQDYS
jgi:hypothetical protein